MANAPARSFHKGPGEEKKIRAGLSRLRTASLASHPDIENRRPETCAGNWSDVAQNAENCAAEFPRRLANSRVCRAYFCEPDIAYRDGTGWLGRQDSNLGMAESKSKWFALFVNAHSEKMLKFDLNPIKRLAEISECRDASHLAVTRPALRKQRSQGRNLVGRASGSMA